MVDTIKMKGMVFVVGNSRSGTTMMGRILARNEQVFTFKELHFFEGIEEVDSLNSYRTTQSLRSSLEKLFKNQFDGYFASQPSLETLELIKQFESAYTSTSAKDLYSNFMDFTLKGAKKIIGVDQTPRNILFINELLHEYPDSKVIIMIRDPRDVLLSQKNKWRRRFLGAKNIPLSEAFRSWANYHPITISKLWKLNASKVKISGNNHSVFILKYEDLVMKPESILRKIADFLNLEYTESWMEVPHIGSSANSDNLNSSGIKSSNIGLWRRKGGLNPTEVWICEKLCKLEMNQFNYSISGQTKTFGTYILWFTWPFKLTLALFLNIRKMKNLTKTIRRRLV